MRFLKWTLASVAAVLMVMAVLSVSLSSPSWGAVWGVATLLLVSVGFGLGASILSVVLKIKKSRRSSYSSSELEWRPESDEIVHAYRSLDSSKAVNFSDMVVQPRLFISRLSETVSPAEGISRLTSRFTLSVPQKLLIDRALFPLLLVERGEVVDGLSITGADGRRVSSVDLRSTVVYLAAMIRVYVRDAGGEAALRRYTVEVEPAVLAVLASQREPHHRSFFHVADDLESVVSNTGTAQFALLLSTLRFLWRFYPVLVPLPDSSDRDRARPGNYRLRYVVEQDSALRRRTFNGDWRQRPTVIFRNAGLLGGLILGVRRNNIAIPLDSAERSQSYHLRCEAPAEDTYLGDQHFEDPNDGSFAQLAGLRGQSYSHLYINGGSAYQGRFMWNWFFEVPPGSAGVAGIAAFASLFGISILAFNQLHWAPQSAWNSATLLLGLPGVVVAFLGVGRSSGFFVGSLRARLSTIVSLAVSLVGLAAAAVHTRSTPHRTTLFVDDLANLPPILIFWSILVMLQLLNLLAIGATWMSRTVVYWGVRKIATTGRRATDHRAVDLPRVES